MTDLSNTQNHVFALTSPDLSAACDWFGMLFADPDRPTIDDSFVANLVSNFRAARCVNSSVATDCQYLAEDVCQLRFALASKWLRRSDGTPDDSDRIETWSRERPRAATLASELLSRISRLNTSSAEVIDAAVRGWMLEAFQHEQTAFADFLTG